LNRACEDNLINVYWGRTDEFGRKLVEEREVTREAEEFLD